MKAFLLLLFVPLSLQAARPVKQYPLDEYTVIKLAVPFDNGNTTVLFPSALSGIYGSKITRDPGKPAEFLLTYKDGGYYFQIRALTPQAKDTLTVIYNRKAYTLQLEASATPVYTATFFNDRTDLAGKKKVPPARLLALLDKAKSYGALVQHYPEAVSAIEYVRPARIMFYKNFRCFIDEVFRFEPEDTVIFRVLLQNDSLEPIRYDKDLISVRLADRIYSQSIVDASGEIPPGSLSAKGIIPGPPTPVYFAITGTPHGGRNNLSADNRWNVLVPAHSLAPGL
jgi:hypothetical protein